MPINNHSDYFFVLAAVGLGLILAGGANLVLGGRAGRRVALRAVAGVGACGAAFAVLSALDQPAAGGRAAALVGAVLAASAACGSGWVHRRVAELRRPAARWGLLTASGGVLLVGAGVAFDRFDRAAVERDTRELELLAAVNPGTPTDRGHAVTDRGARVALREPAAHRNNREWVGPEERLLHDTQLAEYVIRRGNATDESNCHGWVFTGGRFIVPGDAVDGILTDNGYAEIPDPRPGDIAVYRHYGSVAHTAVVRYVADGQPVLVEGKWGTMGVFLHPADKSPYGVDYTFHRSARSGHLLAGVGSPTSPAHAADPHPVE